MLIVLLYFNGYSRFTLAIIKTKKMLLCRRYWLYYLLKVMAGDWRQTFVVLPGSCL